MDLDQAIAILDSAAKHWRIECDNPSAASTKKKRRYNCKVWADGKRFTVSRRTPIEAALGAIERITQNRKNFEAPMLRLVRT